MREVFSMSVINRNTAIVGFVLSFVTGAGFMYAAERAASRADSAAAADGASAGPWKQDAKIPVSSDDPALGRKNAPVTLVIFSDFQCSFCSRVEPTLKRLRAAYGDKLRIVWKDLPLEFHENALPAAIAARVAHRAKGNAAFFKVHDRMFANQAQLSNENYAKWLADVGVDKATFEQHRAAAEASVKANLALAKSLGIDGTPTFLIDGEPLTGAVPLAQFKSVIDAHLTKANELRENGVPEAELYASMVGIYFQPAVEHPDDDHGEQDPGGHDHDEHDHDEHEQQGAIDSVKK